MGGPRNRQYEVLLRVVTRCRYHHIEDHYLFLLTLSAMLLLLLLLPPVAAATPTAPPIDPTRPLPHPVDLRCEHLGAVVLLGARSLGPRSQQGRHGLLSLFFVRQRGRRQEA